MTQAQELNIYLRKILVFNSQLFGSNSYVLNVNIRPFYIQ